MSRCWSSRWPPMARGTRPCIAHTLRTRATSGRRSPPRRPGSASTRGPRPSTTSTSARPSTSERSCGRSPAPPGRAGSPWGSAASSWPLSCSTRRPRSRSSGRAWSRELRRRTRTISARLLQAWRRSRGIATRTRGRSGACSSGPGASAGRSRRGTVGRRGLRRPAGRHAGAWRRPGRERPPGARGAVPRRGVTARPPVGAQVRGEQLAQLAAFAARRSAERG